MHEVSRRVWGLRLRRTEPELALAFRLHVAFRALQGVGVRIASFRELNSPPRLFPCLRFAVYLAVPNAKLGAERIATPYS